MTAANKTTETETKFDTSAPSYSRAEMLHALANDEVDHDRAVATAAELEHLITWMRARGLDAGVAPIPALRTLGEATADLVERPAHYTQGDVECIDAIKAQLSPDEYRGFLRGQVAKYGWRLGRKGSALEDAQKARWYLARLVRELGGGK